MPLSMELFEVQWDVIEQLAQDSGYMVKREHRGRDAYHRFIDYPDPILER